MEQRDTIATLVLELEGLTRKLQEVAREAEASRSDPELAKERVVKAWMVLNRIDRTLAKLYGAFDDLEWDGEDGDGAQRARLALVSGEDEDDE